MAIDSVKLDNGITVKLDQSSLLGRGGEGKVYRISSPSKYAKTHCIKIYNNESKAQKLESKISYMVKHIPQTPNYVKLCWPERKVYYKGKFRGYLMPLAFENSRNLYEIMPLNFYIRPQLPREFVNKFDRQTMTGIINRMKLNVHIAATFYAITSSNKYVLVDIKPDNILFCLDTKISIVDCDSFQISDNGKTIFKADVCTPEYSPPEFYTNNSPVKDVTWDYFSFGVLTYYLMYGVHPFVATFKPPYDNATDIPSKIKAGLFVHGSKSIYLEPLGADHPHLKFKQLPLKLKKLWINTFDLGLYNPNKRTTFKEFGETFASAVSDIESKKKYYKNFGINSNSQTIKKKNFFTNLKQLYNKYRQKSTTSLTEILIEIYIVTGILTFLTMLIIITVTESNGFIGIVFGIIKGIFLGTIVAFLWPIFLLGISKAWFIIFPFLGSLGYVYFKYYKK